METPWRDIRITLDRPVRDGALRATLWGAPGSALAAGCAAFIDASLSVLLHQVEPAVRAAAGQDLSAEQAIQLGRALATFLLPAPIRAHLVHEISASAGNLRLWVDSRDPLLADLPWEFLYLDEPLSGSLLDPRPVGHLALHPSVHLVRDTRHFRRTEERPGPAGTGARVLVVCANPGSAAFPALAEAEAEAERIRSCAARSADVEVLSGATQGALAAALKRVRPRVVHFVGHASALPSGAALVLHGRHTAEDDLLYVSDFASLLRGVGTDLVVLSACRLGAASCGAVRELAASGASAVVAIQIPVRDATGPLFSGALYLALASGCGVEESVRQGRNALRGTGGDWGGPVLALAVEAMGPLFERATAPTAPTHTNLPFRRNPAFVGRQEVMGFLRHKLSEQPVALFGVSGLGKTMLAAEFAHANIKEFPGGVYWIDASSPRSIQESYAAIGQRFFGVPDETSPESAARRTMDCLQELDRPALVILDDVEDEKHIRLPVTGPCHILVTTRLSHLWESGFYNLKLEDLDEASSLQLLQFHRTAGTAAENEAARKIAAKLGHLPHALSLAAHSVKRQGIGFAEYLDRLPKSRDLISVFDPIRLAWQEAPPRARALLQTAAHLGQHSISVGLLYRASGINARDRFEGALQTLERQSLVSREADDRLALHSLVRLFVREHTAEAKKKDLTGRTAAATAEALRRANELYDWRSVREDLPHARELADSCRHFGLAETAARLLRELGVYSAEHGEPAAAVAYLVEARENCERAFGEDSIETASCRRRIAEVLQYVGDSGQALREARRAYRTARSVLPDDDPGLADYLNALGWVLKMSGFLRRALPYYRAALELNQKSRGRNHPETLVCLNNIGMLLLASEAPEAREHALAYLRETLAVAAAILDPDHSSLAAYHNNLGQALQRIGTAESWQEALEHHLAALAISDAAHGEPHPDAAAAHYYAAECCRALGRVEQALHHAETAIPLYVRFFGENDRRAVTARNQERLLRLSIEHAAT